MKPRSLGKMLWTAMWGTAALAFWCVLLGVVTRVAVVCFQLGYGFARIVLQ